MKVESLHIEEVVKPVVEGQGYDLVDVTYRREHGSWVLRVTIDKKPGEGSISHEDCVSVSREISALLDVHNVLQGHYTLEISSPGPERPLKDKKDFQRFIGKLVRIRKKMQFTQNPVERRNYTGELIYVDDEGVELLLEDKKESVKVPYAIIEKANLFDKKWFNEKVKR